MPVFDFNNTPDDKKAAEFTYTIFYSGEGETTPEKPLMVLDNQMKKTKKKKRKTFSWNV